MNTKSTNFVSVNYTLLQSKKLNSTQKLFISYILGWQSNNKICFESNKTLADQFGLEISGVRSLIQKLNKFDFFSSIKEDEKNTGKWNSKHKIKVDITKLNQFLATDSVEVIQTPQLEKKIQPETSISVIDYINQTSLPITSKKDLISMHRAKAFLDINDIKNYILKHYTTIA